MAQESSVFFSGTKVFNETNISLNITIVDFPAYPCMELIVYNPAMTKEAPRIYLNKALWNSKITEKDVQKKLESEILDLNRKKKKVDRPELCLKVVYRTTVKYVMSRLNVLKKQPKGVFKVELTPLQGDIIDPTSHKLDIVCHRPLELVPYVIKYVDADKEEDEGEEQDKLAALPNSNGGTMRSTGLVSSMVNYMDNMLNRTSRRISEAAASASTSMQNTVHNAEISISRIINRQAVHPTHNKAFTVYTDHDMMNTNKNKNAITTIEEENKNMGGDDQNKNDNNNNVSNVELFTSSSSSHSNVPAKSAGTATNIASKGKQTGITSELPAINTTSNFGSNNTTKKQPKGSTVASNTTVVSGKKSPGRRLSLVKKKSIMKMIDGCELGAMFENAIVEANIERSSRRLAKSESNSVHKLPKIEKISEHEETAGFGETVSHARPSTFLKLASQNLPKEITKVERIKSESDSDSDSDASSHSSYDSGTELPHHEDYLHHRKQLTEKEKQEQLLEEKRVKDNQKLLDDLYTQNNPTGSNRNKKKGLLPSLTSALNARSPLVSRLPKK